MRPARFGEPRHDGVGAGVLVSFSGGACRLSLDTLTLPDVDTYSVAHEESRGPPWMLLWIRRTFIKRPRRQSILHSSLADALGPRLRDRPRRHRLLDRIRPDVKLTLGVASLAGKELEPPRAAVWTLCTSPTVHYHLHLMTETQAISILVLGACPLRAPQLAVGRDPRADCGRRAFDAYRAPAPLLCSTSISMTAQGLTRRVRNIMPDESESLLCRISSGSDRLLL